MTDKELMQQEAELVLQADDQIEIESLEERDALCEVRGACLCTCSCGCSSCSCIVICS